MLELERETTPTSVTVTSATNGTVIEVRSATSPTAAIDQTTVLGTGTVTNGTVTIPLTDAPKSKYLIAVRHEDVADLGQPVPVQDQRDHRPGQLTLGRSPAAVTAAHVRESFVGRVALTQTGAAGPFPGACRQSNYEGTT